MGDYVDLAVDDDIHRVAWLAFPEDDLTRLKGHPVLGVGKQLDLSFALNLLRHIVLSPRK